MVYQVKVKFVEEVDTKNGLKEKSSYEEYIVRDALDPTEAHKKVVEYIKSDMRDHYVMNIVSKPSIVDII